MQLLDLRLELLSLGLRQLCRLLCQSFALCGLVHLLLKLLRRFFRTIRFLMELLLLLLLLHHLQEGPTSVPQEEKR